MGNSFQEYNLFYPFCSLFLRNIGKPESGLVLQMLQGSQLIQKHVFLKNQPGVYIYILKK